MQWPSDQPDCCPAPHYNLSCRTTLPITHRMIQKHYKLEQQAKELQTKDKQNFWVDNWVFSCSSRPSTIILCLPAIYQSELEMCRLQHTDYNVWLNLLSLASQGGKLIVEMERCEVMTFLGLLWSIITKEGSHRGGFYVILRCNDKITLETWKGLSSLNTTTSLSHLHIFTIWNIHQF